MVRIGGVGIPISDTTKSNENVLIAPCLQTTGIEDGVCQYSGFSSALDGTIDSWMVFG